MALQPGTRVGVYEILSSLGAGGMGEVYRARDSRLQRDVALKVLPPAFTEDVDRVARFTREARVLASLNHPHIGTIYGFEDGDVPALVLELVDGETLHERLTRGPLPLADGAGRRAADCRCARCRARDRASSIAISNPPTSRSRPDGVVKVLDFGLAKIVAAERGGLRRILEVADDDQRRRRWPGVILGTAAYMAPEQARGKVVDKRADIWAFGVVLYEMLTGRRAFEGEDVSSIMAAVIQSEPRWDGVPASVRRLLESCLEKDPKKRLRDIGDVWKLLGDQPAVPTPNADAASLAGQPRHWLRS